MKKSTKNLLVKCFEYKGKNQQQVYKIIARNTSINVLEAKKLFNVRAMNSNEKVLYIELVTKYHLG